MDGSSPLITQGKQGIDLIYLHKQNYQFLHKCHSL